MTFTRKGDNSDLYIYEIATEEFTLCCEWCLLLREEDIVSYNNGTKSSNLFNTVDDMCSHIQEHIAAEHKVPEGLIDYIKGVYNNDKEALKREEEDIIKMMEGLNERVT